MDKRFQILLLLIPALFALFAVKGEYGFFSRAGVSLSCAVIVWVTSKYQTKWWVVVGLLVSVVGDWFMVNRNNNPDFFLYGICFFFLAHVCFLLFCLKNGRINRWLLVFVLTGYVAFFFLVLRPAITQPTLLVAVFAYLLVSCLSLATAAGLRLSKIATWIFTAGITLFVFSDTIIALSEFASYRTLNFLILPTYFTSHGVITLALMMFLADGE